MHDDLVKRLRNCVSDTVCMNGLITEAADAIEELSKPKWIPVTERLTEIGVLLESEVTTIVPAEGGTENG